MRLVVHNHVYDAERGNAGKRVGVLKHPGLNVERGENGYSIRSTTTGEEVHNAPTKKGAHGAAFSLNQAKLLKIVPTSGGFFDAHVQEPGSSSVSIYRLSKEQAEALKRHLTGDETADVKEIWINRNTYPSAGPRYSKGQTVTIQGFENVPGKSPRPANKTGTVKAIKLENGQYKYTIEREDGITVTVPQTKIIG